MTLRDAIWLRKTTQVKVAHKANCSNQLLSMVIHGRRKLNDGYARKVAKALRCDLRQLKDGWDFIPVEKLTA